MCVATYRACAIGHLPAAKYRNAWLTNTHIECWTMRTTAVILAGSIATTSVVHGSSCLHTILNASCCRHGKRQEKFIVNQTSLCCLVLFDAQPYCCFINHQIVNLVWSVVSCMQDKKETVFAWQTMQGLSTFLCQPCKQHTYNFIHSSLTAEAASQDKNLSKNILRQTMILRTSYPWQFVLFCQRT